MFPDKLQNILYGSALIAGHSQSHTPPSHYPHLFFCKIKGYFQIFQVIYFHYEYWKKILPYLPQEKKIIQCQEKSALMSSECFKKFEFVFISRRLKKRHFFSIWFCKHSLICSGSDCFSIRLPIQYLSKLRLFQISGYLVWVEIFLRPPADWIKVKIKKNKRSYFSFGLMNSNSIQPIKG